MATFWQQFEQDQLVRALRLEGVCDAESGLLEQLAQATERAAVIFLDELGEERVAEIQAGDPLTLIVRRAKLVELDLIRAELLRTTLLLPFDTGIANRVWNETAGLLPPSERARQNFVDDLTRRTLAEMNKLRATTDSEGDLFVMVVE